MTKIKKKAALQLSFFLIRPWNTESLTVIMLDIIWTENRPECTAHTADLIVFVSLFFPTVFIACAKSHLLLVRLCAATPKRRCCDKMLNNNQALPLNLHQKSLIRSDRQNTSWPCILLPSPLAPNGPAVHTRTCTHTHAHCDEALRPPWYA